MSPAEMGQQSGKLPTVTVLWSPVMSPAEMGLQSGPLPTVTVLWSPVKVTC